MLDSLVEDTLQLGINMQLFSLSIRSLYAENSISSSVENGPAFIQLRDATRNDAVVYLKGVMPQNETCVQYLNEYFAYYETLSFEEWEESLAYILEEVTAYRKACTALVQIHEDMMTVLLQREATANLLCKQFNGLENEYDAKIAELRKQADSKLKWACGLAFIPHVGAKSSSILACSAKNEVAGAVAGMEQQRVIFAAARVTCDVLIPALKNFMKGLANIGFFFDAMLKELESFSCGPEKKKRHYKMLKKRSNEIKNGCLAFQALLPSVRSDFQAIPTEGTDFNYVDAWLKKQKKSIEEACLGKQSNDALCK